MDALWIIRFYTALLVLVISVLSVNGLQCWQCDTFTHPDGCWGDKANKTGSMCLDHEDVCIKIVTKYQMPHHGPRNRTAEKEMDKCEGNPQKRKVVEYLTKACGEKESFTHFTKTDKKCQDTTIGGGGTQMTCMCSGNLCNAATHFTTSTILLSITALVSTVTTFS